VNNKPPERPKHEDENAPTNARHKSLTIVEKLFGRSPSTCGNSTRSFSLYLKATIITDKTEAPTAKKIRIANSIQSISEHLGIPLTSLLLLKNVITNKAIKIKKNIANFSHYKFVPSYFFN